MNGLVIFKIEDMAMTDVSREGDMKFDVIELSRAHFVTEAFSFHDEI